MNVIEVKTYCISLPESSEEFLFGEDINVFMIKGKMFGLLTHKDGVDRINLKADPDESIVLRKIYDSVIPGYHMNKTHWNTVLLDESVPSEEIEGMIDNSYDLVIKNLKKSDQLALKLRHK